MTEIYYTQTQCVHWAVTIFYFRKYMTEIFTIADNLCLDNSMSLTEIMTLMNSHVLQFMETCFHCIFNK
jgi:hypothetical protein